MEHIHFFSLDIDKTTALPEEYSLPLVVTSYLIAVLAGYASSLINDFINTKEHYKNKTLLKIVGGTTLGLGIWSMHFVGMLALDLKIPIKYDAMTTVISIFPATLSSISIIHFMGYKNPSLIQISLYGLLLAIGISAMHFIGMAAMILNSVMIHNPITFVFAIAISWAMATITLAIQLKKITFINNLTPYTISFISALTFGFSVATMHYIAMQSAYFFPTSHQTELIGVNIESIEKAVLSGVVILLLTLSVVLNFKNKIFALEKKTKLQDIQILDTVENMAEPFIFTDENGKILLVNNSFKSHFEKVVPTLSGNNLVNTLLQQVLDEYIENPEMYMEETKKDIFEITLRTNNKKVWLFRKSKSTSGNYIYTWIDITAEVKRQEELIQAKDLSINALEQLQKIQDELADNKRLASIGKLVNNIAHELNTPIGISITSLSCLKDNTHALLDNYNQGNLKKSNLSDYFQNFEKCEKLARTNLNKTSKLIERFKLISGEQYEHTISKVNLKEFFGSLKHCLKNEINDLTVSIKIEVSEDIYLYTSEDLLSQIINILYENSITHGFNNQQEGTVFIYVSKIKNNILIAFKDSGEGICSDIEKVIFEPFTSSKKFDGNTGLGLHIAHNIAHQQLGGELSLKQSNSNGTVFHITLPNIKP